MEVKEMMKFSDLLPGDLFAIVGINDIYIKSADDPETFSNSNEPFSNAVTLYGFRDVVKDETPVYKLNGKLVIR